MKIVEVNDNDIYGRVFNGYDIAQHFKGTDFDIKQLVVTKFSKADYVKSLFSNQKGLDLEYLTYIFSNKILSVHSLISVTTEYLKNNNYYKNADLVHLHQIHNSHFGLIELKEMLKRKPTVISLHDPWFMTGRCVHPENCSKWKTGCKDCENLESLFPFSIDNCDELWNIKQQFLKEVDADIIVSSEFMLNMLKESPVYKFLNIHLLPFGIDREKYNFSISKSDAKQKFGIDPQDIVIFFREAKEKGSDYIVSALNKISINKKITIITCSQKGLLNNLDKKYNIIELGNLDENSILDCYNASDIFLMPSLGESFGMMAVEAMAAGLPVVIFNNTSLPSVTNAPDVGVLVKNKDVDDLADKIKNLIMNESERIRRGFLGKELVKANYDLNSYEENLRKIYEESYKRQSYKINKKIQSKNEEIDFNNIDVQNCLYLLKELYVKLFPNDKLLDIFNQLDSSLINVDVKVHYSNINVQRLINLFNIDLYNKTKYYEKRYGFVLSIKHFLPYRFLRKIKNKLSLNTVTEVFSLKSELSHLNDKYNNLLTDVNNIQKNYDNVINDLNKKISVLSKDNGKQKEYILNSENSLYNSYKNLEIKLWQINTYLNKYLYENSLKFMHKDLSLKPKVSIIIPAYNASNYIANAIDSALMQSYKNIEIIVVNDGSNDDNATRNIALSYGDKIRYFEKENGGVSSALNYGIKKMTGEYFAWLSHDDLIDYNHIEMLVNFISYKENYNCIPFTNFKIIDENGDVDINQTIIAQLNCNDYKMSVVNNFYSLLQGEINGGSVLIKKDIFEDCGYFNENLRITQERDLWSRLIKKYHFVNIPYDTASIRVHGKRVTSTFNNVIKETDKKNLEILANFSNDDIMTLESNLDLFYKKIETFYKINDKEYMIKDIEKIRKDSADK